MKHDDSVPSLDPRQLVRLFYSQPKSFGELAETTPAALPRDLQTLLVHGHHMTDALQRFHDSPVDLVVLDTHPQNDCYSRKILLTRRSDGQVVQLGLVRLFWQWIPSEVRLAVEQADVPLGGILEDLDVLRSVQLEKLWQFRPHSETCRLVSLPSETTMFGRTARILVNHASAIDLLEIAVPTSR